MFGMEDGVYGGEADILVHAAVAGDVVSVEKLIVVGSGRLRSTNDVVAVSNETAGGIGAVRDVDQELVAGGHRVGQADRGRTIAFNEDVVRGVGNAVGALHHHHREAVGALDEVAIVVRGEQRN